MAFANQIDDKDEELDTQPGLIGGESTIISGQGAASESAPTPVSAPAGSGTGAGSGSNFVGIQQYINANKPQSAKLAEQVGGYVEGLGANARNELNTAQTGYNTAVGSNTVEYNPNLFNEVGQNAAQVAADAAKKAEVEKQRTAQYKGPNSFLESDFYNPAQTAVKAATSASDQTSNEQGQKQMLAQFQQQPRVNQGALAFDSALLSSDPTARTRLEQARQANSDLQGSLDTAVSTGLTKAQEAAAKTAATNKAANEALGTQFQSLKDMLEGTATTPGKVQAAQENYVSTEDIAQGKALTDKQLASMGVTRDLYNAVINDPIAKNLLTEQLKKANTLSIGEINKNTVASADDYAREQALLDLMGATPDQDYITTPEMAGKGILSNKVDAPTLKQQAIAEAQNRVTAARNAAKQIYAQALAVQSRGQQSAGDYWPQYYAEQNIDRFLANPAYMKYWGIPTQYADTINQYKNAIAKYNSWQ